MSLPSTIAIDGPAASGKSTLALQVARHLNYLFFDTGVMYRAITWAALQRQISLSDEVKITELAEQAQIDVRPASVEDGRTSDVIIDNEDVTWKIREARVDAQVSIVSAYPGVRLALTEQQRQVGKRGQVVMVGRDIGTVVLPEADMKIYLDASVEQRAQRRYEELVTHGQPADYNEILKSMRKRDHTDTNRKTAPLRPAGDALILNSDDLTVDQVVKVALNWIKTGAGKVPALEGEISLITILADDIPTMLRFYNHVLGFKPQNQMDSYVEFEHKGVRFALCSRSTMTQVTHHPSYQDSRTGQAFELALEVQSIDQVDHVYLELLARGAKPVSSPETMPWGQRTAFFMDPEGNIHEVFANISETT